MRSTVFLSRAGTGLLLAGLVATSGCSWFRKTNDLYAQAPEVRPLEVPPDLDQPNVANAVNIPVPAASSGGQARAVGFTTTGTRDDVYAPRRWASTTSTTRAATSWCAWSGALKASTCRRSTRAACPPAAMRRAS